MSKAFTSEDRPPEEVVPARPRLAPGQKRYLTPEGHLAMQQALERLLAERARVSAEPASLGSAPRLAALEREAQALAEMLEEATVVTPDPAQAGRVFFGAWVTLEDEEGKEARYRIVGPDEADVRKGFVSVDSPLARALLGKREGEEALVEKPRGRAEYTIRSVRY
jgi:transcription elongation factor GreB